MALFAADHVPGETTGGQVEDLWNVTPHIPSAPFPVAPALVTPLYREGAYLLANAEGNALFVPRGACTQECAGWHPLAAGMAARRVGAWAVLRDDTGAHWTHGGRPVFVGDDATVPAGGEVLRP